MKGFLPFLVAAGTLAAAAAQAQPRGERVDFGKREFDTNCASCHGHGGKGDGPLTELLTKRPPDLTQLARRNGGVFPLTRMYDVIDGADVPAHGGRDMPVWGRDYRVNVCAHPVLGKVKFDIFDTRGKLLFSSDHANGKTFVDFKMATTQQLMVRVSVPASKSAILHEGCLTVLIGSKP